MNELEILEQLARGGNLSNGLGNDSTHVGKLHKVMDESENIRFFGNFQTLADHLHLQESDDAKGQLGVGPNMKIRLLNNSATVCQVLLNADYNYAPGGSMRNGVLRDGTFTATNSADADTSTVTASSLGVMGILDMINYFHANPTTFWLKIEGAQEAYVKTQLALKPKNPFEGYDKTQMVDVSAPFSSKDNNSKIVWVQRPLTADREKEIRLTLVANADITITIYPVAAKSLAHSFEMSNQKAHKAYHGLKKHIESTALKNHLKGLNG